MQIFFFIFLLCFCLFRHFKAIPILFLVQALQRFRDLTWCYELFLSFLLQKAGSVLLSCWSALLAFFPDRWQLSDDTICPEFTFFCIHALVYYHWNTRSWTASRKERRPLQYLKSLHLISNFRSVGSASNSRSLYSHCYISFTKWNVMEKGWDFTQVN